MSRPQMEQKTTGAGGLLLQGDPDLDQRPAHPDDVPVPHFLLLDAVVVEVRAVLAAQVGDDAARRAYLQQKMIAGNEAVGFLFETKMGLAGPADQKGIGFPKDKSLARFRPVEQVQSNLH